jgi:alginate O-acetyltransferase complex protein AlgJ
MTEAEARAALDGKVLRGRDGWLFLDNDANHVLKQHTGDLRFSSKELEQWRFLLETRTAWLERHGIPYFFIVAPDAHSVYPEKLPERITTIAARPVVQLVEHLRSTASFAPVIYPLAELLAAKQERRVYSQTDSHWNFFGAFVAYARLMEGVATTAPVRQLRHADIVWAETDVVGGLGYKVEPHESSPLVHVDAMPKHARLVEDNCILNNGSLLEFECDEAPPTSCLVLGDSSSVNLLLFLAESFGHLTFAHNSSLDFELVLEKEPDVVISVMTERFMIRLPFDLPAKPVRQVAREKEARGAIRSRMTWWGPA